MNQQNLFFNEIDVNTATNGTLGFKLGHAADNKAKTGVSVIYFPDGAKVGCDISGGGPASRETPLTMPLTADNPVNAIVFSGGSAYGLAASDGVMKCLEDNGIGYDTGVAKVPLVCQSCIFDLGYGNSHVRPDYKMGYEAHLTAHLLILQPVIPLKQKIMKHQRLSAMSVPVQVQPSVKSEA